MKKPIQLLGIFLFLFTTTIFAQQGINYKALITDNGSAMANQSVTIQFTILQNGTTNVYQEEHTTTTDANGIAIVNIGEGTQILGVFNDVDWRKEQFLKVEINTGSGFEDFGTTAFKAVPHAKSAEKLLPTDKVIIGDTDTYATEKLYVKNANPDSELVDFRVGDLTAGKDVLNLYIDQNSSGSGSNNRSQFIEATRGSSLKFKVDDDGRVFSKTGYYTDGYMEATGDITTYGNLEVDGEIHNYISGDADMKAYVYGTIDHNGILYGAHSDGFTVSVMADGVYDVILNDTSLDYEDLVIVATAVYGQCSASNVSMVSPRLIQVGNGDCSGHSFRLFMFDLNGNLRNDNTNDIYFVAYKK